MSGLIRGTFGGIRAWADLAGSLNEKAALWTAVTVVLGALGNLFGLIGRRRTPKVRPTRMNGRSSQPSVMVQTWAWPPSTKNSAPATNPESSEARNATTLAISSGSATRPIGTWVAM